MESKRILILSYFFPPCNLTASNRPYGWARFFNKFGYRPTVITRNWNIEIADPNDLHKASGDKIEYHEFESYNLILVPFKPNYRDKLFTKNKSNSFDIFLRKTLTILELVFQNFLWFATPYKYLYQEAKNELSKKKYDALLVTGNPFVLFKFGHYLSKKFNVRWFADYRDDWSTSESINKWYYNLPFINFIAGNIERRSEKKWLSNTEAFFSISENYVQKIESFINKKGYVVYNGYIPEDFEKHLNSSSEKEFTVCFNGTLIGIQPIEIFLEAYKKLIVYFKDTMKLKIIFVGTNFQSEQGARLQKLLVGFEENVEITKRITHEKAIEMQAKAHLLLLVSFSGITGAPGSKIFDYLGLQKPILLCPTDHGIMEKIATSTNQAIICNTEKEVFDKLKPIIENFIQDKSSLYSKINYDALNFYTREHQSKIMVEILNKHLT